MLGLAIGLVCMPVIRGMVGVVTLMFVSVLVTIVVVRRTSV